MIRRVKGTRDIIDTRLYDFVVNSLRKYFTQANFSSISTPTIENLELFTRSLGKLTDVVSKEMYTFSTNNKEILCLRPEGTASVTRAFLENNITEQPYKVMMHGPMFRHERPQKGRLRQFHQYNLEVIGTSSIIQDAHFIALLNSCFSEVLNLNEYVLSINFLGSPEDRANHKTALFDYLSELGGQICDTCLVRKESNILRVFDCKNETCKQLYQKAPVITDYLSEQSQQEWEQLNKTLDVLSISRIHDTHLVRGLDYYSKTAFEFSSDALGAQNAFCGGGHYELASQLGHKKEIPSIGAAIGIERLILLLEANGNNLALPELPALHLILPMGPAEETLGVLLSQELQNAALCNDLIFGQTSLKNMLRKADKLGASFVLIIGEDELQGNRVLIKNMRSGKSEQIKQGEVVRFLKQQ